MSAEEGSAILKSSGRLRTASKKASTTAGTNWVPRQDRTSSSAAELESCAA